MFVSGRHHDGIDIAAAKLFLNNLRLFLDNLGCSGSDLRNLFVDFLIGDLFVDFLNNLGLFVDIIIGTYAINVLAVKSAVVVTGVSIVDAISASIVDATVKTIVGVTGVSIEVVTECTFVVLTVVSIVDVTGVSIVDIITDITVVILCVISIGVVLVVIIILFVICFSIVVVVAVVVVAVVLVVVVVVAVLVADSRRTVLIIDVGVLFGISLGKVVGSGGFHLALSYVFGSVGKSGTECSCENLHIFVINLNYRII